MISTVSRCAGLLAAVLLAGCSDLREEPRGDLFIRSVVALDAECSAESDPQATMLGFGRLDIAFGEPYIAPLLVGNSLPDDVRGAALRSYTVRVTGVDGTVASEFSSAGNGFVPPPSAEGPGWGVMLVELLPLSIVFEKLVPGYLPPGSSTRVDATVRVFGELGGGLAVESSELTHPITVCNGCLISFPSSAIDAGGFCNRGEPPAEAPCKPGQDAPIDCRLCQHLAPCLQLY